MKEKVLFPFRYFVFSVLFKNLNNNKIFPKRFLEVNNFMSYIFDVSTYISLKKNFDSLVKLKSDTKEYETDRLFSGEFDHLNAIIEIEIALGNARVHNKLARIICKEL